MQMSLRTAAFAVPTAGVVAMTAPAAGMTAPTGPMTITFDRPHPVLTTVTVHKQPTTYTVRRGDTLSKIAQREYGTQKKWPLIWYPNRRAAHNPNLITVGMRLRIPHNHPLKAWLVAKAQAALPPPPKPPRIVVVATPSSSAPVHHRHHHHYRVAVQTDATYNGPSGSFEACVIRTESGGNPRAVNPTSGAGGLYQFLPSTWERLGFSGLPQNASVATQRAAFQKAYAESGTSPWAPYDGC